MKLHILFFGFMITASGVLAQSYVDIARIYYNNTALNNFENSSSSTRATELGLDLNYPILLKSGNAILTGLSAETTQVKLFESENISNLSSFTMRLGLNYKYSDRLWATYLVIPRIASDLEVNSPKNLQMGALALFRFNESERRNYKVGLFYNSELFGTFFVPILGVYHLSENRKFEANITLPNLVDINYKLNPILTAGLNFVSQIRSYRISNLSSSSAPGYLRKGTNEPAVYLRVNFTKNLSLQSKLGYTIGRRYRVYNEGDKIDVGIMFVSIGDDRTQLNTNFADGLIYQGTLLYRFVQD